jgi:hypothetical protein
MNKLALACMAAMSIPMAATAATKVYTIHLGGANEVPANPSPATGLAVLTVDDSADTISFAIGAMNLQGAFTMSHIHAAAAGANGPVVFSFGSTADLQGPVTIGGTAVPGSYALLGSHKPASPLADQINAAPWNYYVNVHTQAYPGGEVRGQVSAIPEPAPLATMLAGLGVVGLLARRRRRR